MRPCEVQFFDMWECWDGPGANSRTRRTTLTGTSQGPSWRAGVPISPTPLSPRTAAAFEAQECAEDPETPISLNKGIDL